MIRLFLSLEIPSEIKTAVLIEAKKFFADTADIKWEDESKIHLTLKFIGDVPKKMVNGIANSLQFIEKFNSVRCGLSNFGFFPDDVDPRILWAGLKLDNSIFSLLAEVNNELEKKFSIPAEWRKFKPHLTLLRLKNRPEQKIIEEINLKELPQMQFITDKVVLYNSMLQPSGSVYKEIKKYKLK
jgi:2'-5' RNA ligase